MTHPQSLVNMSAGLGYITPLHWHSAARLWSVTLLSLCVYFSLPPGLLHRKQAESGPEHGQTLRLPRAGRAPRFEAVETPDLDQALGRSR